MDDSTNGAAAKANGKVVKRTSIDIGPYAGRELEIEGEVEGMKCHITWRLYLVKHRLIQVGIVSVGKAIDGEDKKKFFDSFGLSGD